MATPFEIHRSPLSPAVKLATAPQLSFIGRLIAERTWHDQAPGYVARVAVISATLAMVDMIGSGDVDPAHLLTGPLTDPADTATTFHEIMLASLTSAERDGNAVSAGQRQPLTCKGASALIDWLQGLPVNASTDPTPLPGDVHTDGHADPTPIPAGSNTYGPDVLIGQRRPLPALPGADVVPAGRYAIDTTSPDATNATAFYRVDRPTEGRWAGRVFVKHIVGPDEQRLSWVSTKAVLTKIAQAGAQAASVRYGHEIGNCGVCGRQLTNDESRAAGIGPVCRAKMDW